ncbi:MAG: hypothetical protein ABW184_12860 [Sphingobium sp.]
MSRLVPTTALIAPLLLTACTSGGAGTDARPQTIPGFALPSGTGGPANGVVGLDARALQRQFGKPRLDIRDPTAHKLQFAGGACVLDAYLYPPDVDKEPLVTFAEARTAQGAAVDVAACAKSLRGAK